MKEQKLRRKQASRVLIKFRMCCSIEPVDVNEGGNITDRLHTICNALSRPTVAVVNGIHPHCNGPETPACAGLQPPNG